MIFLFGISITFFLAVLLISKKNKSEADFILSAWLVFIGIHLTCFYFFISEKYVSFPYYLGFELPLPFVHGPFLYWYTRSLTRHTAKKGWSLLHFLPFLLCYVFLYGFLTLPFADKIYVYQNKGAGYETIQTAMNIGVIISGISYVLLSLLRLARHRKFIKDQFSYTDKINLAWLRYLIIGIGVIWIAVTFGDDQITFSIVVVFVFFIGYFGIRQAEIFTPRYSLLNFAPDTMEPERVTPESLPYSTAGEADKTMAEKSKYEKSGLKESDLEGIRLRLDELMSQEKLYTDPELTLPDLAKKIGVHPNYLSQAINTVEQKNFFDYINEQRVEEFKRMASLPGNQQFTLLSLAFECGFNSKTSFNRNFKKATGLTPSEYLSQKDIHLA